MPQVRFLDFTIWKRYKYHAGQVVDLPEDEAATVVKRGWAEPIKRGPGRPRKQKKGQDAPAPGVFRRMMP